MNRMKFVRAVAYLVILGLPLSASSSGLPNCSASSPAGRIMGTLLDVNDARVARAKIKVESASFQWQGESDEAGDFTVEVPAGTYRIYVGANGFRKFESAFLKVKSDVTEMVNLHLEVLTIIDTIPVESKKKRA
jgi:hypothetical protein